MLRVEIERFWSELCQTRTVGLLLDREPFLLVLVYRTRWSADNRREKLSQGGSQGRMECFITQWCFSLSL